MSLVMSHRIEELRSETRYLVEMMTPGPDGNSPVRSAGVGRFDGLPVAELAEGVGLELPHPFPGHAQPAADLLERQDSPSRPKRNDQDGALAVVEPAHQSPRSGPLVLGFHRLVGLDAAGRHTGDHRRPPRRRRCSPAGAGRLECPATMVLWASLSPRDDAISSKLGTLPSSRPSARSARRHCVSRPTSAPAGGSWPWC